MGAAQRMASIKAQQESFARKRCTRVEADNEGNVNRLVGTFSSQRKDYEILESQEGNDEETLIIETKSSEEMPQESTHNTLEAQESISKKVPSTFVEKLLKGSSEDDVIRSKQERSLG